jgi:hypothetical protein
MGHEGPLPPALRYLVGLEKTSSCDAATATDVIRLLLATFARAATGPEARTPPPGGPQRLDERGPRSLTQGGRSAV